MKWEIFLYGVLIFLFGFLLGQVLGRGGGVTGRAIDSAPSDFLTDKEILVFSDKVVVKIPNATIGNYDSTGSMEPVLGESASGIQVKPNSADDISVGDIVVFKRGGNLIVHRVIEKSFDAGGVYFITRGDNSEIDDGKVRFGEIEGVVVGVVY